MVGAITEALLCWIQTCFLGCGGSQAWTGVGNEDWVNGGEDQGLTRRSRETKCLLLSAAWASQDKGKISKE